MNHQAIVKPSKSNINPEEIFPCLNADIGVFVTIDEGSFESIMYIAIGQLAGQVDAKLLFEQGFVVNRFVLGAHAANLAQL
jgi:hypothetical protein